MDLFAPLPTDDEILAAALDEIQVEDRANEFTRRYQLREEQLRQHRLNLLSKRDAGICESCDATEGVKLRPARTAYHWEGDENSDDNPNRDWMGCETCDQLDEEYWDEMWSEYNSGRL